MVPMLQGPWRAHPGRLPRSPHTPNRRQQPAGLKGRGSARGTSTVHLASLEAPTTQPRCCERCAGPQGVGLRRCTQEEGGHNDCRTASTPAMAAAAAKNIAKRSVSLPKTSSVRVTTATESEHDCG